MLFPGPRVTRRVQPSAWSRGGAPAISQHSRWWAGQGRCGDRGPPVTSREASCGSWGPEMLLSRASFGLTAPSALGPVCHVKAASRASGHLPPPSPGRGVPQAKHPSPLSTGPPATARAALTPALRGGRQGTPHGQLLLGPAASTPLLPGQRDVLSLGLAVDSALSTHVPGLSLPDFSHEVHLFLLWVNSCPSLGAQVRVISPCTPSTGLLHTLHSTLDGPLWGLFSHTPSFQQTVSVPYGSRSWF